MAQLSDKFEEYLSGLSDTEWKALESRVRTAPAPDDPAPAGGRIHSTRPNDYDQLTGAEHGLAEARRRGYVKESESR